MHGDCRTPLELIESIGTCRFMLTTGKGWASLSFGRANESKQGTTLALRENPVNAGSSYGYSVRTLPPSSLVWRAPPRPWHLARWTFEMEGRVTYAMQIVCAKCKFNNQITLSAMTGFETRVHSYRGMSPGAAGYWPLNSTNLIRTVLWSREGLIYNLTRLTT